jgi:hypothetical protein
MQKEVLTHLLHVFSYFDVGNNGLEELLATLARFLFYKLAILYSHDNINFFVTKFDH